MSVLGRHPPLPKAIARNKFFPLQSLGLKPGAAKFPPSQVILRLVINSPHLVVQKIVRVTRKH